VPRKTEWIHRIPKALDALRQSPAPLIDRRDIERLLEVSGRHAIRILHRLGAAEAGKNLFIAREELIARFESIHDGDDARYERRRLQRLDTTLARLARDLKARQVPVAAAPEAHDLLFPSLPGSIRLRPGRLEIDFETPDELLTRLYELSQALANDYGRFEQAATAGGS
jgi:hypothetical protein